MSKDFKDFVGEIEEQSSEEEHRALGAARARFRIGTKILQQRLSAGMTQQQLAAASGIAQADISRIEHGQSNPTAETLEALAQPLGITLDFVEVEDVHEVAEA